MDKAFTSYRIEDRSFVSYLKREIHSQLIKGNFSEMQVGEIDIIVSELSSNLIKHAGSGEILYRINHVNEESVFEILSIDKGPGMSDPGKMVKDGVSTTQTLGHGLGAIKRLSSLFQLYSIPGWGTILYSMRNTKESGFSRKPDLDLDIRALCVNKPREIVCGDGYRIRKTEREVRIFFGDGLGHGENAKEAVDRAGDFFLECEENNPVDIIRQMHDKVRRTRGLVGTIAIFDKTENSWRFCGVGNILTRMYNGVQHKNYMSYNGTIGLNLPHSMNSFQLMAEKNQHLIMCSDGIQSRWDPNKYSAVYKYDTTILAAAIYKDFNRGTDDASVLVAKVI